MAISRLGYGVLNAVNLEFSQPFWDTKVEIFNYVAEEKGVWAETINMGYYLGKPILCMFASGTFGKAIEKMTEKQVIDSAMTVLKKIWPKATQPIKIAMSRWNSDPFSYGSYSFSAVGVEQPKDRNALKETVAGRIFFAGEATSVNSPATTQGAY